MPQQPSQPHLPLPRGDFSQKLIISALGQGEALHQVKLIGEHSLRYFTTHGDTQVGSSQNTGGV